MPRSKKTLDDLGPFLGRLNASAFNYFNNADEVCYSKFLEAVQLGHNDRKRLKLHSNEGVRFWRCWLEAVGKWAYKFPQDVVSDVMHELECWDSSWHNWQYTSTAVR
jgi:hypothetical protein